MLQRMSISAMLLLTLAAPAASQPAARMQAAVEALQNGDGDKAAALFEAALQENPDDPRLLFGAGLAAHLRGRDDDARHLLERAVKVEPRFTAASAVLGELVYEQGDLDSAIKIYEEALKHAPMSGALAARLKIWRAEAAKDQRVDGRFSIEFEGPEEARLAARATKLLDGAYWRLAGVLGAYPSDPITVVFYTTKQFRAATGAPEWSAGAFDTRIRIPVRGALATPGDFERVLTHELGHAMIAGIAPRGVPAWLHEGLATLLEPADPAAAERRLRRAHTFVPLEDLQDGFTTLTEAQARVAYDESLVAANLLVQRLGTNTAVLLQDLAGGEDLTAGFADLGRSFPDFEQELAGRLR
ncbi:MAG: tetratricopeptide repeat protein [Betaproteobacteria bacterium]